MSKYTTEVRFICETFAGLDTSVGYSDINSVLNVAIPKVFDFDFPIFDEAYRSILERKILKHFYTREIGEETIGLWKLRLDTRLNEIMPYYNQLYKSELLDVNPLYTTNLERTQTNNIGTENETKTTGNGSTTDTTNTTNTATNRDLYSDTPQGSLVNVENETYLTNARKTIDNSDIKSQNTSIVNNSTNNTSKMNTTEKYIESVKGYSGWNVNKLVSDFRKNMLNIDMLIIEELETLFMQLW